MNRCAARLAEKTQGVKVMPHGMQPFTRGAVEHFSGAARIESRFQGSGCVYTAGGIVRFGSGARTAWHTHSLARHPSSQRDLVWFSTDMGNP
jgi:quercetin dioxygenase-like cupin family protein